MRSKKLHIIISALFLIGLLLMSSVVMSFSSQDHQTLATEEENQKTERLFHELGMINVPHIAPPVDISLKDINGQQVIVSEFEGKIVFLNFWTTWCPECRIEMPSMEKLHGKLKGKDFAMIAIDLQESLSRVKTFLKKYPVTFTILLDTKGEIAQQFGIRAIPTTYIIDKNGGIIGKALGSRHWDSKESITLFEHLMNRVVQTTKSNGHEQKKGISSNFVKSDTGIGNSADDPASTD
jgi:peroxiredoxin